MGAESADNSCHFVFDPAKNTRVNIVQCDIVPVASALDSNLLPHRTGTENDNILQLDSIFLFRI